MTQRFLFPTAFSFCLVAMAIVAQTPLRASIPTCHVVSDTYAYDYPSDYLGARFDDDYWTGSMNEYHCAVNLSQNAVKQWGKEVCDQYGAGYVVISWRYYFYDSNDVLHTQWFNQPFDCGDLP